MRPSYRLPIIIFATGLVWAFYSDLILSSFENSLPVFYLEAFRIINNVLLFGLTGFPLYRSIRKQQQQLKRSEEQYRNIFESNPNPMWIFHRETYFFIAVNNAAIKKYGYTCEEFLSRMIWDIRPVEEHELLKQAIDRSPSYTNEEGIWHHIKKSGEVFPVAIVSHDINFNNSPCKMVIATDMSPIINNEEKLKSAYQKEKELYDKLDANYSLIRKSQEESRVMGQVMNKINNLVLTIQEGGIILWVNQAYTDFTGYTLNEVKGKNPGEILFGPKTDLQKIERLIEAVQKKMFFSEELINYKKSGEPYWTELNISPIYDEKGDFMFFVSVETIITERKEKEQKILDQHAALQKIAWSHSHELRRPVCSILGLVDVMQNTDQEEERETCLNLLKSCTMQLDQLLQSNNQEIEQLASP